MSLPFTERTLCPIARNAGPTSVVAEARHIAGGLDIRSKVEHVEQHLRDALRLHVATHQRDGHQRTIVPSD